MLSTWPEQRLRESPISFTVALLADMDAPQLGFLEIAFDAERVGIDQRKDTAHRH